MLELPKFRRGKRVWPSGTSKRRTSKLIATAFGLPDHSANIDGFIEQKNESAAFIFGSEGHGLAQETLEAVDWGVKIPMAGGTR